MKLHVKKYSDWPTDSYAFPALCGFAALGSHEGDRAEAMAHIGATYQGNDADSKFCGSCLQLLRLEQIKEGR